MRVSGRLILRELTPEDAPRLLQIYSDPVAAKYWANPDRTLEESRARIARALAHWREHGFGDWALIDPPTGALMGFCGLHYITGMAEVNLGYMLDPAFWGRGIATDASRHSIDFGFQTAGLDLIVGVTHPDNKPSIRVLEKVGMIYWKTIERFGPRVVYRITREGRP